MKDILDTFQTSIYNPTFYKKVASEPLAQGFQYYLKAILALAVFATLVFAIFILPQAIQFMKNGAPALIQRYYPSQLEVRVEKGTASINSPEPYFIPGERNTLDALSDGESLDNMLVIDTRSDFDKKIFEEYKTFAFLTNHSFVTRGERGQITIQDLREVPSMTITMENLLSFAEKTQKYLPLAILLATLAIFLLLLLGYVVYLVPLLLFALIPFFLGWMKGVSLSYRDAYAMSLYAVVPGLVLKTLFNLSGFFWVPAYLSLLVFMLIVVINMKDMK